MESEEAKLYIASLLNYQFDLLYAQNNWGENHAEFLFIQTSRVLLSHSEIKQWFLQKIELTLNNFIQPVTGNVRPEEFVPLEYILFLAHQTKWPEFEDIAKKLENSKADIWVSNPLVKSSETLRKSLSEDWEEKEFYETFMGTQTKV
jgi:hypothetical protein